MLAVAIILGADAVAALLIGTFLFRGRARERVAANGPPDATITAVAPTAPAPVVSNATLADALEPTVIAAAGPLPGASETPQRVTSRHLVLTVGAGLVLGAVVLAHRR